MSTVKIQVIGRPTYRTDVLVDNVMVYQTGVHPTIEMEKLKKLVEALKLENVEVTDKEKV